MLFLAAASPPVPTDRRASCAVTKPSPTLSAECRWGAGSNYWAGNYGNNGLSTSLFEGGTVVFRPGGPGFVLPDGSLSMKFPWCRSVRGKLTITGRRLDAPAPPLRASIPEGYGEIGFQATALIFPTAGCWEVTGKVGEASLTFVTRVVNLRESASKGLSASDGRLTVNKSSLELERVSCGE